MILKMNKYEVVEKSMGIVIDELESRISDMKDVKNKMVECDNKDTLLALVDDFIEIIFNAECKTTTFIKMAVWINRRYGIDTTK